MLNGCWFKSYYQWKKNKNKSITFTILKFFLLFFGESVVLNNDYTIKPLICLTALKTATTLLIFLPQSLFTPLNLQRISLLPPPFSSSLKLIYFLNLHLKIILKALPFLPLNFVILLVQPLPWSFNPWSTVNVLGEIWRVRETSKHIGC